MPAESSKQRSAFGMALAARRGDIDPKELYGAAKKLYNDKSLSNEDLAEYARKPEEKKKNLNTARKPKARAWRA